MAYSRAYSTLGSPDLSLDQTILLAVRHGLAGVELRALGGTLDLPGHLLDAFGSPSALAARLRRERVAVVLLDTSFKLAGGKPEERAAFLEYVPWAEALGVRLRVFDGGTTADQATLDEMAGTLAWWRGLRSENRWQTDLMVETHDTLLTAEVIGRLGQRAPDTGILWDAHHTWRRGGEDPLLTWRAIAPQVVHIHVKDSVGGDKDAPFTYCLPGEGQFPMRALRAVLRDEFSGPVSLEWEKLWHPTLPPVETALAVAAKNDWW